VLIIVQNMSVPLDRRVWLECRSLRRAGFEVSVICPRGRGEASLEELEGVKIHRYPPPPTARGTVGWTLECLWCWVHTAIRTIRVLLTDGVDAVQTCNPPDVYWTLGWPLRLLGRPYVFDQHDLCPEVYQSRFDAVRPRVLRLLERLESMNYLVADQVIAPNDSYRAIALDRGGRSPSEVTVVRSGPEPEVMCPGPPDPGLRRGRPHLLVWLGIMGVQDRADLAVEVLADLVHRQGRDDCHLAILGYGDCYDDVVSVARSSGVEDRVTFAGRCGPEELATYLRTAAVGLSVDPPTPFNEISTMNKTLEYMSFALPVVTFDLAEARVSAGPAAVYVEGTDVEGFATEVAKLLDDPERRRSLGELGRARIVDLFAWSHQEGPYVEVYRKLLPASAPAVPTTATRGPVRVSGPV
jgi:glycosyltransferase involved in cell wall biosynthesis